MPRICTREGLLARTRGLWALWLVTAVFALAIAFGLAAVAARARANTALFSGRVEALTIEAAALKSEVARLSREITVLQAAGNALQKQLPGPPGALSLVQYRLPYLDGDAMWVWETRSISGSARDLIDSLLAGPRSAELTSAFPQGTRLKSAELSRGILGLDFTRQFDDWSNNNDVRMAYALMETVRQIPGIGALRISVEGNSPRVSDHVIFETIVLEVPVPVGK